MRRYVYQTPSESKDTPPDEEELGCSFTTATVLWTAWHDHGTMAVAGGLLDQPRWWWDVISIMNEHHAPIHTQHMNEQYPDQNKPAGNTDNWIEDGDAEMGAPVSFDRLRG